MKNSVLLTANLIIRINCWMWKRVWWKFVFQIWIILYMIDWCLTPTLALFPPYGGVNKFIY